MHSKREKRFSTGLFIAMTLYFGGHLIVALIRGTL